jgi:Spy/CpxP family protein refolding chaperone
MRKTFTATIAAVAIAACAQRPETTNTSPAPQPQIAVVRDTGMPAMREGGHRGMRGMGDERMDAMMFEGITMTDAQKAQVDSIHARHRGEMQGLDPRNNAGDREKMRQMMQAHMAEIRAVLTPDQQAVFDRNVAQMRERRGQRDGGAPPRE